MNRKPFLAIIAILLMTLSVYFSAGAQAQTASQESLTIYHMGPDGTILLAETNAFGDGEIIWLGVPKGASSPYWLAVKDQDGNIVAETRGGTLPSNNLIPLSLVPGSFAPNQRYQVTLGVSQNTLPGMAYIQNYAATLVIVPGFARLWSENFSRSNNQVTASVKLSDEHGNSRTGVRLGLFLTQGAISLPITNEKTDSQGRATFTSGEALAAGKYQYEARVLDNGVFANPLQLPQFTVGTRPTILFTWSSGGNIAAALLDSSSLSPVPGRLLVLQHELNDGNYTIDSTAYTDDQGRTTFPTWANPWRVSFNGDSFYSASSAQTFSGPPRVQPTVTETGTSRSAFSGTTFANGHITVRASSAGITIYDSQGVTILGHMSWEVQALEQDNWHSMAWDGPLSMSVNDVAGQHRVSLQGTVGNGSLAVSMFLLGKPQDAPYTPLRMPVQLTELRGSHSYRLIWHLDTSSPDSVQFEQRIGGQRMKIAGPVTAGSALDQSPSGENSLVAFGLDGKTILIGLNWDSALSYYEGAHVFSTSSGTSTSVQFGTFALASGQTVIVPACPCPDGGGGGGGTVNTTTTLYLPSSFYATITTILKAQAKDQYGNPVYTGTVNFYKDGTLIGGAYTNSTGFASLAWTPNTTGSHVINATFIYNGYDLTSSAKQSITVNQTPTTTMILKPQTIAYSWDLYNYYNGYGRPIVVPVEILALALSNNSGPGSTYIPTYNGNSTSPPHIYGYGWAGLNQSAVVTINFNGTSPQSQAMNWTRNFYMPPCPTPPSCSTTPRTGHMYFTASLAPPSTLYTSSSTSLSIPYQILNTATTATNQLSQTATSPAHVYVNVNATYPYINVQMQNVPIALEAYTAYLAYSLGGPTSSSVQCPKSGCFNYYSIPVLSSSAGSDFAYACASSGCSTPAANVQLNLYNSKGQLCISTTTDNRGIAHLNLQGPSNCNYPYYYLGTTSTQVVLSELFATEAISSPNPFYTNFQGYNYAIYAPYRTGRYLLHMHVWYQSSSFTVLYPSTSYPDVQQAILSCCDVFLTVEKHPVQVNVGITPGIATVVDNVNATIVLTDQAQGKGMPKASVSYFLKRTDPNPTTLASGTLGTGGNGNVTLSLGKLSNGNYTLTVSWAGNSTSIAASYQANFTIWRARTIIIISPGWIHATAGNTYLFTTTLIDNATKTVIAVSGLTEQVYVNGALYSNTQLCTTSACSVVNYYLTNPGGNVTFPWQPSGAGQYFINATFPRQNYYPSTSFQIEASVTLRPVLLVAINSPFQPHTGDTVTWTIQAYDMLDNASIVGLPITPNINGSSYAAVTTDSTGHATFTNKFTVPGFYDVIFSSAQNALNVYNSATTQNSLKVFTLTTLTISGGTVYLGQQNSLSVSLKDNSGNPLGGRTVQIKVNGVSYTTVTTGSNGQASFNWQPISLGNYTVAASYSPTGPSDAGFEPSSASVIVNVKPLTVVNTQSTGSGTQSLTLNVAQGSAATGGALSYSFQFSPSSATVTLQFNGRQSQASVNLWNEFGWICVARVFGACVLSVPYLKIHVDMGVPNVFDLHLASFVPFGPPSVAQDVNTSPQPDIISEELGTAASLIIPIVGTAIIIAGGGPLDLGAVWVGGLVNALGLDVALLAAVNAWLLGTMSRDGLKSFIEGLIIPVIAGAACAVLACEVDLPALPPPIEIDIAAIGAWAFYWVVGVIIPWALEGYLAAFAIGVVLLLAGLIYSGL